MASLKSCISSLLSSYRDSHKSVPSTQCIGFSVKVGTGQSVLYTAPCDGFLIAKSTGNPHFFVLRQQEGDYISTDVTGGDSIPVTSMPILKGITAYCYSPVASTVECLFYKAVGS